MFSRSLALFSAIAMLILASACTQNTPDQYIPYGPFSASGTLTATGVSLIRRGTHGFVSDASVPYFVESKTVNLQEFTGQRVYLEGDLQPNTYPKYHPVIVVKRVVSAEGGGELQQWKVPSLGIQISTPKDWKGMIDERGVAFQRPQDLDTILQLKRENVTTLPAGTPFHLRGRIGVRTSSEGLAWQDIVILAEDHLVRLSFTPLKADPLLSVEQLAAVKQQFEKILSSLVFLSDIEASASSSSLTGSGSTGTPCGGSAGVLCPQGFYCEIYDQEDGVGKCKARERTRSPETRKGRLREAASHRFR